MRDEPDPRNGCLGDVRFKNQREENICVLKKYSLAAGERSQVKNVEDMMTRRKQNRVYSHVWVYVDRVWLSLHDGDEERVDSTLIIAKRP
jgi:hypothetical protein